MPTTSQQNLETVPIDFLRALRRGDFDAASSLLDPEIAWRGLRDDFVCHGRDCIDAEPLQTGVRLNLLTVTAGSSRFASASTASRAPCDDRRRAEPDARARPRARNQALRRMEHQLAA